MTEEYKKQLEETGINWEVALERFAGNEPLYLKFLIKFPEDNSFSKIKENIENGKEEEAFKAAHTLKGVVGNLSIDILYQQMLPFVEFLRANNLKEAQKLWPEIEKTYEKVIEAIKTGDAQDKV